MKEIQKCVGIECEGFEEPFMALLTAIKAGHAQIKKLGSKKQMELKRLTWSINYKGSSSRGKSKGRAPALSL